MQGYGHTDHTDDWQEQDARCYTFPAARQAYDMYGKDYADYIESHTAELIANGHLTEAEAQRDLGTALIGNDGD